MLLVIADTGPIRYLVQIDQIDLLARLFENIVIPAIVAGELRHPSAPPQVQAWMKQPPAWLKVLSVTDIDDPELKTLDPGERSAIALGISLKADLLLIDERKGVAIAVNKGFETTGTLGVLDLAAKRGLIDLRDGIVSSAQISDTGRRFSMLYLMNRRASESSRFTRYAAESLASHSPGARLVHPSLQRFAIPPNRISLAPVYSRIKEFGSSPESRPRSVEASRGQLRASR